MISIDNQLYYIDLAAIEDYVFKASEGRKDEPTEEEEKIFGPKNELQQRTVVTRSANDDKYTQIRYDLVKGMLEMTYNSGVESTDGDISYVQSMDENSVGAKLIFNTLIVNGFIKDKLD